MKSKRIFETLSILAIAIVCALSLCACTDKNKHFDIPDFSTVGELIDAIDSGEFTFESCTWDVEEYEEGDLSSKTTMKCGKDIAYGEIEMFIMGISSIDKTYYLPDLSDNYVYIIMNNFITNGWSYSKTTLEFEDYDGSNFATISLKRDIVTDNIDLITPVTLENGEIKFETTAYKFRIDGFNATSVTLDDGLKDYKQKAVEI